MIALAEKTNISFYSLDFRKASAWIDPSVENSPSRKGNFFDRMIEFFSLSHLLKKIKENNEEIFTNLQNINQAPVTPKNIQAFRKIHSQLFKLIDQIEFIRTINEALFSDQKHIELVIELKRGVNLLIDYELKIRLRFFPEKNKVVLTYDELKELRETMKGWEPADEQSEIYN